MQKKFLITLIFIHISTSIYSSSTLTRSALTTARTIGLNIPNIGIKSLPALQFQVNNLINTTSNQTETTLTPIPQSPRYISKNFAASQYKPINIEEDQSFDRIFDSNIEADASLSELENIDYTIEKELKNVKFDMPDYSNNQSIQNKFSPHGFVFNQQKRSFSTKIDYIKPSPTHKYDELTSRTTAYHEAGHAIGIIFSDVFTVLKRITIEKRFRLTDNVVFNRNKNNPSKLYRAVQLIKFITALMSPIPLIYNGMVTASKNQHTPAIDPRSTTDQIYLYAIRALAGVVSEQIFGFTKYQQEMLTDENEILKFLKNHDGGSSDMSNLKMYLRLSMYSKKKSLLLTAQDEMLLNKDYDQTLIIGYKKTFTLLTEYKNELEEVANVLLKNGTVSGNDIYTLLKIHQPFSNNTQDSVSGNFSENYKDYKDFLNVNWKRIDSQKFGSDELGHDTSWEIPKVYTRLSHAENNPYEEIEIEEID